MQKLWCYVDETGQDTEGNFFVVAVVLVEADYEQLENVLTAIEQDTKKGKRKWMKSKPERRYAYIRRVLKEPLFRDQLYYGVLRRTISYVDATVETTARAIVKRTSKVYRASVFVDGLSRPDERRFGQRLRTHGIRTDKVRGVRDEEASAFIRLADALCGFLREAIYNSDPELSRLLKRASEDRYLTEVTVGK